jgi:kinesin family protein 2/24
MRKYKWFNSFLNNIVGSQLWDLFHICVLRCYCCCGRVKGLSKNNNSKRDLSSVPSMPRESNSSPHQQSSTQVAPQVSEYVQDNRIAENGRRPPLDPGRYLQPGEREFSNQSIEYSYSGREDSRGNVMSSERDRQSYGDIGESGLIDVHNAEPEVMERVQVVLPARRKGGKEEKLDRVYNREDSSKSDGSSRRQNEQVVSSYGQSRADAEVNSIQFNHEGHINAILEVRKSIHKHEF